jgi:putative membrane protein
MDAQLDTELIPILALARKGERRMIAKRTGRKILISLAAALLACAAAIAQNQPGGMGQQPQPGQQPGQGPGMRPGMQPGMQPGDPNYPGASTQRNAPSVADQTFVRSVMESDAVEVQLGQLAQQKSQSDDVKEFGQSMVQNRKRLDDQLVPIAKQLDVNQPKGPSKKDKELIAKLETLSGTQFDEEYIKAVVKGHQKDVKDFQSEAQSAHDPNVQQAAKADAPVLEQHLQVIQKIAESHNVVIEETK